MKTLTLVLSTLLASAAAHADGFVCQSLDNDLNVKVFNKTSAGTRTAAVMVVSDPNVSQGRKTIATFRESSSTLASQGAAYYAEVDASFEESARGGELIAGTKLAYLSSLTLYVSYSYDQPVEAGANVAGTLVLKKTNGQRINVPMACVRYLKGE